jgi:phosphoribosylanthranilate isomerase
VSQSAVRVKICGLTTVEDAVACARLGADWIGLNFHRQSPRYVSPGLAAEIVARLPQSATAVGVFVNQPAADVLRLAEHVGLGIVQLHGEEPPQDLLALGALRIIRAFRLGSMTDWQNVSDYLTRAEAFGCQPYGVLIDAFVAGRPGGTGASIASEILDLRPPLPRLILAGGLTAQNVAARIAHVRPWMVDVASGVETRPGQKDLTAVEAFVRAARGAAHQVGKPPRA